MIIHTRLVNVNYLLEAKIDLFDGIDLDAQPTGPVRAWCRAVSALDPDRVRWELPARGIPRPRHPQPRNPRTAQVS
jgi:hypothetical protein